MLMSNRTLRELNLGCAPYTQDEWAATIFPALIGNHSLQKLDLHMCEGVSGKAVYDAIMKFLALNTSTIKICLDGTPLATDCDKEVQARVLANKAYVAAAKVDRKRKWHLDLSSSSGKCIVVSRRLKCFKSYSSRNTASCAYGLQVVTIFATSLFLFLFCIAV